METGIGKIGNYYGGLTVKSEGDKYFWGIEDYSGMDWQEITEELYNALIKFNQTNR